ncbi:hypothetical protein [Shewanella xiamenensis]|uniref:hypothetical protein n=1 Tax=Shewanella xiamenensis TaxID=332186 RepID=UPI00313D06F3
MVYLEQIEREILNKSSDRELALYRFLEGKKHSFIANKNDLEDELCSKVFSSENAQNELMKLRKLKPFKGFHYTTNLITLLAASIVSKEDETININQYLKSHSYRDLFIFTKALDEDFNTEPEINNSIDHLAKKILKKEKIYQDDISKCITNIHDLLDIFVVKQAITLQTLQYYHNENLETYKELNKIFQVITKKINLFFTILGSIVIALTLSLFFPLIIDYATKNWDFLEPLAYLLDKTIFLIAFLGAFKLLKFEKAKKISIKYYYSTCYRLLGVNYDVLDNLNKNLEQTNCKINNTLNK